MSGVGEVMVLLYDSVQRHQAVEKLVARQGPEGQEKKYYRFRPARWYGGIVTADCVGCGLTCRFCWVRDEVMLHPDRIGRFYASTEVVNALLKLAWKHGLSQLRISGGEPTIGRPHLLQVLDLLQGKGSHFILETNGIPIATDESYARDLSRYGFVHVRISLKGCNEEEFSMLTGARSEGFASQLKSLENLTDANVSCHASVMISFSSKESFKNLIQRLRQISSRLAEEVEVEELILYPHVTNRIRRHGLNYGSGYEPSRVPKEQI
jgi:uncharacterized Fe-S cluster-containing radical SAM superfamily protein